MPSRLLLAASRDDRVRRLVSSAPLSRDVVRRFVAGSELEDGVRAARELAADGLATSLDHLGEDTVEVGQAEANTKAYVDLLGRLADEGLTGTTEVSVKLTAVGQSIDPALALDSARVVCEAAAAAGTTVTLDMEDHTTTDATLVTHEELRRDFPEVGAVIQSSLRRSIEDCRALAAKGARVRLCKGAYHEPPSVAFQQRLEVDRSYVRCLRALIDGGAYPMVATHDPRLVAIAESLVPRVARGHEFQMLYGVRPDEQRRLARAGNPVRVYTPYGQEWYGYLMRRLAERPANVAFFLRALASRG